MTSSGPSARALPTPEAAAGPAGPDSEPRARLDLEQLRCQGKRDKEEGGGPCRHSRRGAIWKMKN